MTASSLQSHSDQENGGPTAATMDPATTNPTVQKGATNGSSEKETHSLVFFLWLVICTILCIVVCATSVAWSLPLNDCLERWGWFGITYPCRDIVTEFTIDDYPMPDECRDKMKGHLQAGGAFSVITMLLMVAACILVLLHDYIRLFHVHRMLGSIFFIAALFSQTILLCIIFGIFFSNMCTGDFEETYPGFAMMGNLPGPASIIVVVCWLINLISLCCYLPRRLFLCGCGGGGETMTAKVAPASA